MSKKDNNAGKGKAKGASSKPAFFASLRQGMKYSDGKTTYLSGQKYPCSAEVAAKLKASGHFHVVPVKGK